MDHFTFGVLSYNQERLILETLESIKYQIETYGRCIQFKLVLVDDASVDRTQVLAERWIEKNKNLFSEIVIRFNKDNVGTVSNFNSIIDEIQEEPFKIIAADDVISSRNLFEAYDDLTENALVTYFPLFIADNEVRAGLGALIRFYFNKKYYERDKLESRFRKGSYINSPSTLFTKKLFMLSKCSELNRQFRLFEDDPTWYAIIRAQKQNGITFSDRTIVLYRVSNTSVSKNPDKENPFFEELEKLRKIYENDSTGIEHLYWKLRNNTKNNVVKKMVERLANANKLIRIPMSLFDAGFIRFKKEILLRTMEEQFYYSSIKERAAAFYASNQVRLPAAR